MTSTNNRKPIEDRMYNLAFFFPLFMFIIGLYLLYDASQVSVSENQKPSQLQDSTGTEVSTNVKVEGKTNVGITPISCCVAVVEKDAEAEIANVEVQTPLDGAYQYFLLGSIIFIVLLILPRLKELTISKDSISIVLQETLEEVEELRTQVQLNQQIGVQAADVNVDDKVSRIKSKLELIDKILKRG